MIHACGMTDLPADLAWSDGVGAAGRAALAAGGPVLCDSAMVAAGITRSRLPAANQVICTLTDPRVPELAARLGTTRSAAAVELWRDHLDGAVVAVGNAPTALFRLLEILAAAGGPGRGRDRRAGRVRRRGRVQGRAGRQPGAAPRRAGPPGRVGHGVGGRQRARREARVTAHRRPAG